MRALWLLFLGFSFLWAEVDCNRIFELRKAEIVQEADRLERAKAELEDLRQATERVLEGKEQRLADREAGVVAMLEEIQDERERIQALTEENRAILENIGQVKDEKLVELYTNMRPSSAGEVMNTMEPNLAARILYALDPKIAADIVARMDPGNAARLTRILQDGPPFEPEE